MSRLEVKTPDRAQAVVEQIYRNMERRIAASPPGLCPVDMALNSLDLCRAQTCGKCVPCRIGLTQLSDMLSEILDGEADMRMLRHLEETAQVHCGYGRLCHRHRRRQPDPHQCPGLPGGF